MTAPLRIGTLLSGGGRTVLNLHRRRLDGDLPVEIVTSIASRPDCDGVDRLRDASLEVHVVSRGTPPDESGMHDRIDRILLEADVDLVCLCGYLRHFRVQGPGGVADWTGRTLNIHPALLPDFGGTGMYGDRVHAAVLEAGRRESGCTVHVVDGIYDHGPIILQRTCPVLEDDDVRRLADRVFAVECEAYPEALRRIASGAIPRRDGRLQTSD